MICTGHADSHWKYTIVDAMEHRSLPKAGFYASYVIHSQCFKREQVGISHQLSFSFDGNSSSQPKIEGSHKDKQENTIENTKLEHIRFKNFQ